MLTNIFSPSAKIALMVLKVYTGSSDRQLVEYLNGNIHYQMYCGIIIAPSFPITNYKNVAESYRPTARKERGRLQGQRYSSTV